MKHRSIFCICLLLLCFLTACSSFVSSFSVEMTTNDAGYEPVMLTVILPDNGNTAEIRFAIDGREYKTAQLPTVDNPVFLFADRADDEWLSVSFVLDADNPAATAQLHLVPADTTGREIVLSAELSAFSRLTDWLGTN